MVAGVHVRIIRAMDRYRDDANVQDKACSALCNLTVNDANKLTLVAVEAHVRIIRAMDRHEDDANVQERACKALRNLAANALDLALKVRLSFPPARRSMSPLSLLCQASRSAVRAPT
jgi:hypothetical protein